MRVVDFHNHYYPPEYVDRLQRADTSVRVTHDSQGNPCVHYPGDYNILVPGHRDIAYRQRVLDEHGVDMQVLTFTTPGVHVEPAELAKLKRLKLIPGMPAEVYIKTGQRTLASYLLKPVQDQMQRALRED